MLPRVSRDGSSQILDQETGNALLGKCFVRYVLCRVEWTPILRQPVKP